MPWAHANSRSRRRLLSSAATMTGSVIVAPFLGWPATALGQTPVAGAATVASNQAATPTLDEATAIFDEVLQAGLDRGLVGVVLRVERGDEVIFNGAAGLSSLEGQTPMVPTDRFRIASVTKTFTAVLVLQLVDEGILTLDDTVSQWLDDPVVGRIPHVEQITVRQLLNHTSGVYDYFEDDSPFWQDAYFGQGADWSRVWTAAEVLSYVDGAKHAPYFAPGEGTQYTNTGYVLLGLILERAGDQDYAEQVHERIIDPLGLTDTVYAATEPVPSGTVDQYHLIQGEPVNASAIHLSAFGPAAGMLSTTRDLARFIDALVGGELLPPVALDAMFTFVPSERPGVEWGLGVARGQTPGGESLGMGGDGPGSGARMFRLTDADLTLVLLTNTGGDVATVETIFAQVTEASLGINASNE
jgi:D-alanyl-D-alanine carboxypeptidase